MKPSVGIYIVSLLAIPVCAFFLDLDEVMSVILIVTSLLIIGYLIFVSLKNKDRIEGKRLKVPVKKDRGILLKDILKH